MAKFPSERMGLRPSRIIFITGGEACMAHKGNSPTLQHPGWISPPKFSSGPEFPRKEPASAKVWTGKRSFEAEIRKVEID
jgi:hypothetical protein